jgi:Beta-propeller repeat
MDLLMTHKFHFVKYLTHRDQDQSQSNRKIHTPGQRNASIDQHHNTWDILSPSIMLEAHMKRPLIALTLALSLAACSSPTQTLENPGLETSLEPELTVSNEVEEAAYNSKFGGVKLFGDATSRPEPKKVAIDSAGNIYVVGTYFGPLGDQINQGGSDVFLIKYNRAGTQEWVQSLGTAGEEINPRVAVSPGGFVYVTGTTTGALFPQVGPVSPDVNVFADSNVFLAKFSPDADGTISVDTATDLQVDANGNIHLAGVFGDSLVSGNINGKGPFVLSFNRRGVLGNARFFPVQTDAPVYTSTVSLDRELNVYVGATKILPSTSIYDPQAIQRTLEKFNKNAKPIWTIESPGFIGKYANVEFSVDPTGAVFSYFTNNGFLGELTRYDNGQKTWSFSSQPGIFLSALAVAHVFTDKSTYVTGTGGSNNIILRLDANGKVINSRKVELVPGRRFGAIFDFALDARGNMFTVGIGSDVNLNGELQRDAFIAKYNSKLELQ